MAETFETNNGTYISAKNAAEIYGYTSDYLGQLARAGKIDSKLVGHTRMLSKESLEEYVKYSQNGGNGNEVKTAKPLNKNTSRVNEIDSKRSNAGPKKTTPALRIIEEEEMPLRPVPVKILSKRPLAVERTDTVLSTENVHRDSISKVTALVVAAVLIFGSYTFVSSGSSISALLSNFAEKTALVETNVATNATAGVLDSIWNKLSGFFVRTRVVNEDTTPVDDGRVQVSEGTEARGDGEGIVVLPTSGDTKTDEETILGIKNTFSDEVEVSLDEDGISGLIKPIFRDTNIDQSYLYVLVPVKDE